MKQDNGNKPAGAGAQSTSPASEATRGSGARPEAKKDEAAEAALIKLLDLPKHDVMLRRVRGPSQGTHSWLGFVKLGRVYCVGLNKSLRLTDGDNAEFEPVFKAHRKLIEEACKEAATNI